MMLDPDKTTIRVQVPIEQATAGRTMEGAAETVPMDITLRQLAEILRGAKPDECATLAIAVGIARFRLEQGDAEAAKRVLNEAAGKTHALLRESLIAAGNSTDKVDSFLGGAPDDR